MSTTMITALFDINREKKGDGRTVNEYLKWFRKTLKLNCNLFIVTEEKFKPFIDKFRNKHYKTYVKIDKLENAKYYKYRERMIEILESEEYKKKIAYPERVECKLPEYNIIQYSKLGWLEDCIELNPFGSEYFFWMDAGLSRFFERRKLNSPYPRKNIPSKKFIIQGRINLKSYNIDEKFIWGADNLLKGGIFGGHRNIVLEVNKLLEEYFNKKMLNFNNVNNEQLCLMLLWKDRPDLFHVVENDYHAAFIFHIL